ncbi:DUF2264 domain-containing protein [Sphingobacterium sp.]|uniref:DUF2264 domain-containing protein n=1 Tax=Sphingobacterium sp. TaxID=341027 RepID=UPI0031D28B47
MKYVRWLACMASLFYAGIAQPVVAQQATALPVTIEQGNQDREYWTGLLYKIVSPVIHNLASGTLKKNMPLEKALGYMLNAEQVTYLEAVGRTMAGVAPWLALPDDNTQEGKQRKELRLALLKGIANAVNPKNPDCLDFSKEQQPIVDAAFMAQGFLRAPQALWEPLDATTKSRIINNFKSLRNRAAYYNNWLLFSALTEAFLLRIGEDADPMRIDIALKKMEEWYLGDGWYSDGPHFAMDYYNSFVIQPMLVDIYRTLAEVKKTGRTEYDLVLKRMQRYATFQERMIGVDGSFPPFGRSITYRTGAFQALAQVALLGKYPEGLSPGQIRSAMTAMHRRMFDSCSNFDPNGWLLLGFCGAQPEVADTYTSTGSLYMTTLSFLPLGLPANNPFWTNKPEDWTTKKAWQGQAFKKDYKVGY